MTSLKSRLVGAASGPLGATVLAAGLVRLAGFFKQIVLARVFGVSVEFDIYLSALVVPVFVGNVIGVAFNAVLVPFLVRSRTSGVEVEAAALRRGVRFAVLVSGAATVVLLVAAPLILGLVSPDLAAEPQAVTTASLAGGLVFLSVLTQVFTAANLSRRRFMTAAIAPLAVPLSVVAFATVYGPNPLLLMIATLVGNGIALVVVAFPLRSAYTVHVAGLNLASFPWREIGAMTLSVVASGLAVAIDRALASRVGPGSLSALEIGSRVQESFEGLMGVVVTNVMATHLSMRIVEEPARQFALTTSKRAVMGLLGVAAVVAVLVLMTPLIVDVLFASDRLSADSRDLVIDVQWASLLRVPFYVISLYLARALNAGNRSWSVARIMATFASVSVAGDFLLIPRFGVVGIPMATAFAYALATGMFLFSVWRQAENHARK